MLLSSILDPPSVIIPLILLISALVINICAGRLTLFSRIKGHPAKILEHLINWFDLKLNRKNRSPMERLIRGCLTVIFFLIMGGVFGLVIAWLSHNFLFACIFELVLLLILIDQRNLYKTILKIEVALCNGNLESARNIVSSLTTKSEEKMDSFGIARNAIEILATSLITRLLAPVFYYILFGFVGVSIYHTITTMNFKIGHKTNHYKEFGITTRRLNSIILLVPGILAGFLIVLASLFIPTANPIKSFKSIFIYSDKFYSRNRGVALAAFAGSFDLALAGPQKYSKATQREPWIGSGTAKVTHRDIHRSLYLYATVCLLNILLIAFLGLVEYL
jgi:adenosylcobinamide-phosphate synthase